MREILSLFYSESFLFDLIFKINIVLPQNCLIMKKFFLLLSVIGMMATTAVSQNPDEDKSTLTFMNCVQCLNYREVELKTDEVVNLVLSACIVPETSDSSGIRAYFYEMFPEEALPGVVSVFLMTKNDDLFIVMRRDLTGETRAMYILTQHGWWQSVDMQEFYYFDELLWRSKYGDFDEFYRPVLRKLFR